MRASQGISEDEVTLLESRSIGDDVKIGNSVAIDVTENMNASVRDLEAQFSSPARERRGPDVRECVVPLGACNGVDY